ncbi:MAG: TIM barrel protein [Aureliella sp.]
MTIKPSVCVDAVFEGVGIEKALRQIATLGFKAFEFWCWWEKDLPRLIELRDELDLEVAACCTKFVSLVEPSVRRDYLTGLDESIAAAQRLGCKTLISQVGDFLPGVGWQQQHDCLRDGLIESAKLLDGSGVTLAIEPLNELVDHAGYYLVRSDEAFQLIDEVASPNVKVTFDIYHQQISEGHLIRNITDHADKIAHFHAAGNPGRNELNSGEIHYPEIIRAIEKTAFDGYFGLEYWPKRDPIDGLRETKKLIG